MQKICTRCRETKSEESFNFKIKRKGIRQTYCRECHKVYLKDHYNNNKSYYKRKAKVHTKRYQEKLYLVR